MISLVKTARNIKNVNKILSIDHEKVFLVELKENQNRIDKKIAFDTEIKCLAIMPEYTHLKKIADNPKKCTAAVVSSNIRTELKNSWY